MSGEFAQCFDGDRRHIWTTAGLDAGNTHLGVTPAGPMDQQHGFVGRLMEITYDLLNQDMDKALLGPSVG
ncbi:hypothetical protein NKK52_30270 [Mesorhizobium sp. C277A]|uniref:hypothetical protein n=1 Tax=Mesorhizobium sp. C277A TaxID=2956827 RepID=UPI0018DCF58C|nr:hypothetical protein [Mesorhizobium sp. LSJC277A00]